MGKKGGIQGWAAFRRYGRRQTPVPVAHLLAKWGARLGWKHWPGEVDRKGRRGQAQYCVTDRLVLYLSRKPQTQSMLTV